MSVAAASVLAGLAALFAVIGVASLASVPEALVGRLGPALGGRAMAGIRRYVVEVRALGSPEVPVTAGGARRLRVVAAAAGVLCGGAIAGTKAAALVGLGCAALAPRLVSARRARHGRRIDEGAAGAAGALADALSAGASARGSVALAGDRVHGPIARELRQTAWELEVGAATDAALERLRERSASRGVGLIVAAMLVQRRSGGDLAGVLRGVARALEDERRLREDARAATAQARFTAAAVLVVPVGGVALAALASPGLIARMTGSPVGVGLLFASLLLQVAGALVIRRLGSAAR